jgi:hydroxyacylglutathione hydrolase
MEIVPGIHQIDGVNGNCYIIARDALTLIDTGLPGNSKKIMNYIKNTLQRKPEEIKTIVLTHFHLDHEGNVKELKQISGAVVAIHEADADYIAGRKQQPMPKGRKGTLFRALGIFFKSRNVEPDILLKDSDMIAGLTCIHSPGHTPGSICLYDPASKVMFVGDTLRFNGTTIDGAPSGFTMDPEEAGRSVRKIATMDFEVMLPGHGIPLRPGAAEKVREYARFLTE